jgi:hypothetical protein
VYGIQLLPITGVSERLLEPEWVSALKNSYTIVHVMCMCFKVSESTLSMHCIDMLALVYRVHGYTICQH